MAAIIYFKTSEEWSNWLEQRHNEESELWVGFFKKKSYKAGITYSEALDVALCFGWIDGIRKRVDDDRYMIRFSPRKPNSYWSAVNVERVKTLTERGLMQPPGLKAFQEYDPKDTDQYSYERPNRKLDPAYEEQFRKNPKAWVFFQSQPPSYRKTASWWVMSAKTEETRQRRLSTLINDSENGDRIAAVTLKPKS